MLSPGDGSTPGSTRAGQSTQDSTGTAQVGSVNPRSGVTIASTGDTGTPGAPRDATEPNDDASPAVKDAPAADDPASDIGRGDRDSNPGVGSLPESGGGVSPGNDGAGPAVLRDAAQFAASTAAKQLPFTGFALLWLIGLGLCMVASGAALRRMGRSPVQA